MYREIEYDMKNVFISFFSIQLGLHALNVIDICTLFFFRTISKNNKYRFIILDVCLCTLSTNKTLLVRYYRSKNI